MRSTSRPLTAPEETTSARTERCLPILGEGRGPFPEPPLYESRKNGNVLVIHPRSGRWWIGPEARVGAGRREVERLSAYPDRREQPGYAEHPTMLVVVKNKGCNLACTYCFAEADHTRLYQTSEFLSSLFRRILDNFPRKETIVYLFSGGEPLIHFKTIRGAVKRFWSELDEDRRERVMFGVMSNGTPITEEMAEFFREYDVNVCVSVDGPPEIHDRNRPLGSGAGSLARVEEKLDLLTEHGVPYSTICTIVHPDDLVPAFEYQLSRGRRNLYMRPLRMQGRQLRGDEKLSHRDADGHIDYQRWMADEFLRLADRIAAYNRTHQDRIVEHTLANHVRHLTEREKTFMCLKGPCGAGAGAKLGVDWYGNLFPCDTLVEFPELQVASVDEVEETGDISRLFDQSQVLHQLSGRRPENIPECSQCPVQNYCGGGCSATSFSMHGDLRAPSDRCDYERMMFEGLLWRFFEAKDTAPLLLGHRPTTAGERWPRPNFMEMFTGGAV